MSNMSLYIICVTQLARRRKLVWSSWLKKKETIGHVKQKTIIIQYHQSINQLEYIRDGTRQPLCHTSERKNSTVTARIPDSALWESGWFSTLEIDSIHTVTARIYCVIAKCSKPCIMTIDISLNQRCHTADLEPYIRWGLSKIFITSGVTWWI